MTEAQNISTVEEAIKKIHNSRRAQNAGSEFHDRDRQEQNGNERSEERLRKVAGQPFQIAAPVEDLIKAGLDEKNAHQQCGEKRGQVSANGFDIHLILGRPFLFR